MLQSGQIQLFARHACHGLPVGSFLAAEIAKSVLDHHVQATAESALLRC